MHTLLDPKSVLIVEDNRDAADMLGAAIETLGHRVKVVHAADEALAILSEGSISVVLSDLGLPGIDGYALAKLVRACNGKTPLLVAISGYGTAADKQRAREAGFDHHVTKPIDIATIARVLSES